MSHYSPIDCDEVLRNLFAWLDDELREEQQYQISAHIESCRSCFSRAEFEKRLKQHLRDVGRSAVPSATEQRIRSLIDQL